MSFAPELIAATRESNLENLRKLLSEKNSRGRYNVTDHDIHRALYDDASVGGSVEACRLLWERLGHFEKQMYVSIYMTRYDSPLHHAVRRGQLELVRLFIEEFQWNIDQANLDHETPLMFATKSEAMTRYLLENGATVDTGLPYGPLYVAVSENTTNNVARLLLVEYQADPNLYRRSVHEAGEYWHRNHDPRITDLAIQKGNAEILRLLLERGAFVGIRRNSNPFMATALRRTHLNRLLGNPSQSRSTKLAICRILVEHGKEDAATVTFMHASYEFASEQSDNEACHILLEAGMTPIRWALYWAVQKGNEPLCRLLVQYGFDPFSEERYDSEDDAEEEEQDDDEYKEHAASPFIAAARQSDTEIFEYFLGVWHEQFSCTGGRNGNGDYPLHVVCGDPGVSLQAVQVLVDHNRQEAEDVVVVAMVDGKQGLLPFHSAARWDACLDVIFYLLQHCPNALRHVGNVPIVGQSRLATVVGDTKDSPVELFESTGSDEDWNDCGPVKKKAKMS